MNSSGKHMRGSCKTYSEIPIESNREIHETDVSPRDTMGVLPGR